MLTWPVDFLPPRDMLWLPVGVSVRDTAINGRTYVGKTDGGGWWRCAMSVKANTLDQVRTALTLVVRSDGGTVPMIVPVRDAGFVPWPTGAGGSAGFGDGSAFSDGAAFVNGDIRVVLAQSVATRAVRLVARIDNAAAFRGFEAFSFDHPEAGRRLYVVVGVKPLDGGLTELEFRPPWREATIAGEFGFETELDFAAPSCLCELVNAEDCVEKLQSGRPVTVALNLVFEEAEA